MSAVLERFQHDFALALRDTRGHAPAWTLQPGFAVYRNTLVTGCIDALRANYPAVARLVGDDWFRAAAREFVRQHWPSDVRLMLYGAGFADFLAGFGPAAELPYLSGVARLDRCWSESHVAADAPWLTARQLATLAPQALDGCTLEPHPAARWRWCGEAPIYTLWSRNREAGVFDDGLAWTGEGALLTRPDGAVRWRAIGRAACAFLDACAARHTLPHALAAARQVDPAADPSALLGELLQAGALRAATTAPSP